MKNFGRIHWLIHYLPYVFKNTYKIRYDYVKHNYCFYRNKGYNVLDCYIVTRTSKRCFRVSYFNSLTMNILYFSCKTARETAKKIYQLYLSFDSS